MSGDDSCVVVWWLTSRSGVWWDWVRGVVLASAGVLEARMEQGDDRINFRGIEGSTSVLPGAVGVGAAALVMEPTAVLWRQA